MNCLFLLLLICCCGNKNNNCICADSCENECDDRRPYNNRGWNNSIYNVVSDNDCECDRRRDNDRNCDNDRHCDNDCDDNHIEPRIFPPYHNNNCGCND